MQQRKRKMPVRFMAFGFASMLLLNGMTIDTQAKESNGLPSAGVDFYLASEGTSVKNIQDEKDDTVSNNSVPKTSRKEVKETAEATTTKTVNEKEREIANKKEEEGFKSLVIAQVNDYVNVRSIPSEEGEILGKLYDKSVGEFIEEDNGWYKITSGSVTGYVKAEYCVTGDDAVALAKKVGNRIATVTTTTLKVREEPSLDATVLGLVPIQDQLLVTEELDNWVKVNIEEGDGYVSLDYVTLSTEFVKAESREEEEARLAGIADLPLGGCGHHRRGAAGHREKIKAEEKNRKAAKSESSATTSEAPVVYATGESALGQSVASYACQFVGNPYVYGGTSLTNGADCSGFVMSVYANFGVSLPHSSSGDRSVGTAVDGLANAQPGDIICYSGHVAIYIGNGQIVHASTAKTGIKISDVNYRTPLGVRRIF